jgi:hypothetical protein
MYFGRMEEVRGLYDAFPIFTMLLTHSFMSAMGPLNRAHDKSQQIL